MKLTCKQDHWPEKKANMLGFGGAPRTKIEGLTEGKEYDATPIAEAHGNLSQYGGTVSSKTNFLIYNDSGEWETYQLDLFEPAK